MKNYREDRKTDTPEGDYRANPKSPWVTLPHVEFNKSDYTAYNPDQHFLDNCAVAVLPSILAKKVNLSNWEIECSAKIAYQVAEAMLKERNKRNG